jgi:hypothetical protein
MEKIDVIEYISGLTSYVFDKALLKRVAMDRGVEYVSQIDTKTRDLLRADLMYEAFLSPNIMASKSISHGNFSQSVGGQAIYERDKSKLYNIICNIYRKYNDPKLEELLIDNGNLQWLDIFD